MSTTFTTACVDVHALGTTDTDNSTFPANIVVPSHILGGCVAIYGSDSIATGMWKTGSLEAAEGMVFL